VPGMGVIKQQSIKSTLITYIGFAIGAVNIMFVMPAVFTKEQFGLIQVFLSFSIQAVTLGSLGMVVVINKFLPYYKTHLAPKNRDLMTIVFVSGTIGMLFVLGLIFSNEDFVIKIFSKNSPLFVRYLYLFPLFAMGYFYSYILELFNNNYNYSSWSSFVREIFYKSFNLLAALVFYFGILDFKGVINSYSIIYWLGALLLASNLFARGLFHLPFKISKLTFRIKKYLFKYSVSYWGISIFSAASQFIETFSLAGLVGLGSTAIYKVAQFIISPIIIPYSSIITASVPSISDAWRRNDKPKIEEIYKKSALISVLVSGLLFFLIYVNINDILHLIPKRFFGSENEIIQASRVIIILGFARLIDFSTSVNSNIMQTSSKYYNIDLGTNIVLVFIAIPANYFLISHFKMIGAAYAYLTLSILANTFKAVFLYVKEKIHPFSKKWIQLFLIFACCLLASFLINLLLVNTLHTYADNFLLLLLVMSVKSILLTGIILPTVYFLKISEDINTIIIKISHFVVPKINLFK